MAIGPHPKDPNYEKEMAKLKATQNAVKNGGSVDEDQIYKSGPSAAAVSAAVERGEKMQPKK